MSKKCWAEEVETENFDLLIKQLVKEKNVDKKDIYGYTALFGAVMRAGEFATTPKRIRLLLQNGADMYAKPDMLHLACTYGDIHVLREFFVYAKANVEKSSGELYDHYQFMLHLLCRSSWSLNNDIFREFVHIHHANVNRRDHDNSTCLMMLCSLPPSSFPCSTMEDRNEKRERIKFLLRHVLSEESNIVLHKKASQIRHFGYRMQRKCVYHVLRHIDINAKGGETEKNGTALHHAYALKDWWFCSALLKAGARTDIPDADGRCMKHFLAPELLN